MNSIHERIKQRLAYLGMSERKLIAEIGMTEAGYYKMLKNNSIKVETLGKISNVLKLPIVNFFLGETWPFPSIFSEKSITPEFFSETEERKFIYEKCIIPLLVDRAILLRQVENYQKLDQYYLKGKEFKVSPIEVQKLENKIEWMNESLAKSEENKKQDALKIKEIHDMVESFKKDIETMKSRIDERDSTRQTG